MMYRKGIEREKQEKSRSTDGFARMKEFTHTCGWTLARRSDDGKDITRSLLLLLLLTCSSSRRQFSSHARIFHQASSILADEEWPQRAVEMLTPCVLNESHTTILLARRSFFGRENHDVDEAWLTLKTEKNFTAVEMWRTIACWQLSTKWCVWIGRIRRSMYYSAHPC